MSRVLKISIISISCLVLLFVFIVGNSLLERRLMAKATRSVELYISMYSGDLDDTSITRSKDLSRSAKAIVREEKRKLVDSDNSYIDLDEYYKKYYVDLVGGDSELGLIPDGVYNESTGLYDYNVAEEQETSIDYSTVKSPDDSRVKKMGSKDVILINDLDFSSNGVDMICYNGTLMQLKYTDADIVETYKSILSNPYYKFEIVKHSMNSSSETIDFLVTSKLKENKEKVKNKVIRVTYSGVVIKSVKEV